MRPSIIFSLLISALLITQNACSEGSSSSGGGAPSSSSSDGSTTFAVTDAPTDQLASFQIEIAQIAMIDSSQNATVVFENQGQSRVNLLELQDSHQIVTRSDIQGSFTAVRLDYEHATALDKDGQALTLTTGQSGSIEYQFDAPITLGQQNLMIEIDIAVDASISDVSTGASGSLSFNPVIIPEALDAGSRSIENLTGQLSAVSENSAELTIEAGFINLQFDAQSRFMTNSLNGLLGQLNTTLQELLAVGQQVRVNGEFDVSNQTLLVSHIEIEDISAAEFAVTGVLMSQSQGQITLAVTETSDPSLELGELVSFQTDADTMIRFDLQDPQILGLNSATLADLQIGQELRIISTNTTALDIDIRPNLVRAVVLSVQIDGSFLVRLESVNGMSPQSLGLDQDLVVEFPASFVVDLNIADRFQVQGVFSEDLNGRLLVTNPQIQVEFLDSLESIHIDVGSPSDQFALIEGLLDYDTIQSTQEVTFTVNSETLILIRGRVLQSATVTAFFAQINGNNGRELNATGHYDPDTNTFVAELVVVEEGRDSDES